MSLETQGNVLNKQPTSEQERVASIDDDNNNDHSELIGDQFSTSAKYAYRQSRQSPDSEDDFKPICKPKIHVHGTNPVSGNRETLRQIRRRRLLGANAKSGNESKTLSINSRPTCSGSGQEHLTEGAKPRPKREPLPMHRRALPQSFFKEPQSMNTSSLAGSFYSVLPPLFPSENCDDVTDVRPVTPPNEKTLQPQPPKKAYMSNEPDTELLFSLFNHLEDTIDPRLIVKRGRPKKQIVEKPPPPPPRAENEDPCIVDALSERLFPKLSIKSNCTSSQREQPLQVGVIRYNKGGRTLEFPAIQSDQNYSAMLNELVTHM